MQRVLVLGSHPSRVERGNASHISAGISCWALSVRGRVTAKVAGQPPGPIVAIARRCDAANRP
jgi:hypothetical protein